MSDLRVDTTAGMVEGVERGGVARFLGVPFGRSPLGNRRFLAPSRQNRGPVCGRPTCRGHRLRSYPQQRLSTPKIMNPATKIVPELDITTPAADDASVDEITLFDAMGILPDPSNEQELRAFISMGLADTAEAVDAYRQAEPVVSLKDLFISYLTDQTYHMPDYRFADFRAPHDRAFGWAGSHGDHQPRTINLAPATGWRSPFSFGVQGRPVEFSRGMKHRQRSPSPCKMPGPRSLGPETPIAAAFLRGHGIRPNTEM
jgi:carboxylesterase type B